VDIVVYPPLSLAGWTLDNLPEKIAEVRQLYIDTLADWPVGAVPKADLYSRRAAPAKKAGAKKTPATKNPAKKAPAKKAPAKKTPAKKTPAKKTPATKTPVKKAAAKKAVKATDTQPDAQNRVRGRR
jgi:putative phosphoserine phosphatase/1-acylglycerol-3-phosphate O-acyltransferase